MPLILESRAYQRKKLIRLYYLAILFFLYLSQKNTTTKIKHFRVKHFTSYFDTKQKFENLNKNRKEKSIRNITETPPPPTEKYKSKKDHETN